MDQRQKSTLRGHQIKLANDLILDEDFFAQLRQHKIFTEGMISVIKDVQKPRDQVFKMLELLEKRGPKAFDNFVWILKENYDWLADMLEETYQDKVQGSMDTMGSAGEEQTQLKAISAVEEKSRFPRSGRPNSIQNAEDDNDEDIDETVAKIISRGQECKGEARLESGKTIKSQTIMFADACVSPILTVESPRKTFQHNTPDGNYGSVKFPNVSQECFNEETGFDKQGDQIFEDEADEIENEDEVNNATENETDPTDEDIESSEVFYDIIRQQSQTEDEESELTASRLGGDNISESNVGMNVTLSATINTSNISRLESSNQSVESEIREIYLRLLTLTTKCTGEKELTEKQIKEIDEMELTFEMIHEQIDESAQVFEKSVDQLKKCYDFFDGKDKKIPLHKLIEKLKNEKTEYASKYSDEVKKTNNMADDMYKHSQERKEHAKLKDHLQILKGENSDLKGKCTTLEGINSQLKDINDKQHKRIEQLEFKNMYEGAMASKGQEKRKTRKTSTKK